MSKRRRSKRKSRRVTKILEASQARPATGSGEQDSGDIAADSGEQDSGDVTEDSADVTEDSGDVTEDSADRAAASGEAAEDSGEAAPSARRARLVPPRRARSEPSPRARSAPPVRIAPTPPGPSPRRAATTERTRPIRAVHTSAWQRHDLLVVVTAAAFLVAGVLAYRAGTAPTLTQFSELGLELRRPAGWLPPTPVSRTPSPLALAAGGGDSTPTESSAGLPYHVEFQSVVGAALRLEVRIDERPTFNNLSAALALDRVNRYGEVYWVAGSDQETIDGRDWLRTRFQYAYKASETDSPRVATGIEYATLNGGLMYVVTVHGEDDSVDALRALISPSLDVDADHPAATRKR